MISNSKLINNCFNPSAQRLMACFLPGMFFRGSEIYCYANFFCHDNFSIAFGPNFRGAKSPRAANCFRGTPPAPVEKSQHGKNYIKVRPLLVRHLLRNRLFRQLKNFILIRNPLKNQPQEFLICQFPSCRFLLYRNINVNNFNLYRNQIIALLLDKQLKLKTGVSRIDKTENLCRVQ